MASESTALRPKDSEPIRARGIIIVNCIRYDIPLGGVLIGVGGELVYYC